MVNKKRATTITVLLLTLLILTSAVSTAENGRQSPSNHPPKQPLSFNLSNEFFLPLLYNPYVPGTFLGKIAFTSAPSSVSYGEIFTMNADGSDQTRLVQDDFHNFDPEWSPDNSQIAFAKGGFLPYEIYTISSDGANQLNLTNNDLNDFSPEWSPDGNKIVFTSGWNSNYDIFVIDSNGANQTQLTFSPGTADFPTWSPDGTKIAYINEYGGHQRITIMNSDGTDPVEIYTTSHLTFFELSWSPNGDKLAFSSLENEDINTANIFTIKIDGSSLKQLTTMPGSTSPSWSPDGAQIAFATNRDDGEQFEVYVMNADGAAQQNITNNDSAHDRDPGWSN
jgi:Tol biopolymer transport system component